MCLRSYKCKSSKVRKNKRSSRNNVKFYRKNMIRLRICKMLRMIMPGFLEWVKR
jgi:hypothetical protein